MISLQGEASSSGSTNSVLMVAKLTRFARIPTRSSPCSAGYDLYSAHSLVIPARGRDLCFTDIQIKVPDGCYGRIAPRSGLAQRFGIHVGAGVIDADFRGNVAVVLFNYGVNDLLIEPGNKIAQLICEKIECPVVMEVSDLDITNRGLQGFGSTGLV